MELDWLNIFINLITNGYVALIPILLWNIVFISKLPPGYQPEAYNKEIPRLITVGENVFRLVIFALPLFFSLKINGSILREGGGVYIVGVILYFISWMLLMFLPSSRWSKSLIGFTAPAFIPVIWLIGISQMVEDCHIFTYSKWHYIMPAILFSIFHVWHSVYVYKNNRDCL